MDYDFDATGLQEEDHITIELPNNIRISIFRGDVGYSVDFENTCNDTIYEMGWVSDDDLDLYEEDEDE